MGQNNETQAAGNRGNRTEAQPFHDSRDDPATQRDYDEHIARRADGGNYFLFFRDYLALMSGDAAILLQSLQNLGRFRSQDGWVTCTRDFLAAQLHMARRTQDRCFKELRALGFILTRTTGIPPKRQVMVLNLRVERALDAARPPSGGGGADLNGSSLCGTELYPSTGAAARPINDKHTAQSSSVQNDKGERGTATRSSRPPTSDAFADHHGAARHRTGPQGAAPAGAGPAGPATPAAAPHGAGPAGATADLPPTGTQRAPLWGTTKHRVVRAAPSGGRPADVNSANQHATAPAPQARTDKPPSEKRPARGGGCRPAEPAQDINRDAPKRSLEKPSNKTAMPDEISFPPSPRDRRSRTVVADADRAAAAQLRELARRQGWLVAPSPAKWGEPLAILRRQLGRADPVKGPAHLDAVLAWYVGWYAPGKKPMLRNGAEFKQRWEWVADLYEKEQARAAPAVLDPDAAFILAELSGFGWPAVAAAQLPAVAAQSHTNYLAFYRRMRSAKLDRGETVERDAVLGDCGDPATYITNWFRAVWKSVRNWDGWSGDLGRYVWRPDHPDFVRAADAALARATGFPGRWAAFARALGHPGGVVAGA
jgi:hypothetical protein